MKSKKRGILLTISLILIIGSLVGATLAYFTDTSEVANNTITIGDVEIDLYEDETTYDAAGAADAFKDVTAEQSITNYKSWLSGDVNSTPGTGGKYILPGYEMAKNTYLENTGDNDAYVRFVVTVPTDLYEFIDLQFGADYTYVQKENVYYVTYSKVLKPGEFTSAGLVSVTLDPEMTEADIADTVVNRIFDITVQGQAVQTVGFTDAADAFAKTFDKQ